MNWARVCGGSSCCASASRRAACASVRETSGTSAPRPAHGGRVARPPARESMARTGAGQWSGRGSARPDVRDPRFRGPSRSQHPRRRPASPRPSPAWSARPPAPGACRAATPAPPAPRRAGRRRARPAGSPSRRRRTACPPGPRHRQPCVNQHRRDAERRRDLAGQVPADLNGACRRIHPEPHALVVVLGSVSRALAIPGLHRRRDHRLAPRRRHVRQDARLRVGRPVGVCGLAAVAGIRPDQEISGCAGRLAGELPFDAGQQAPGQRRASPWWDSPPACRRGATTTPSVSNRARGTWGQAWISSLSVGC